MGCSFRKMQGMHDYFSVKSLDNFFDMRFHVKIVKLNLIVYVFQNGGSRFKRRSLQPPSRDSMYRALVNHTNIIERQKLILEQLSTQVKELKIKSVVQVRKLVMPNIYTTSSRKILAD